MNWTVCLSFFFCNFAPKKEKMQTIIRMKSRITIMLTALLMLFCIGANAQVKGDVNGDGAVTQADIDEVVKVITGASRANGDVSGDGKVSIVDIVEIVNIMYNPETPGARVNFKVKITNNKSTAVNLDGDMEILLANPDTKGVYHGGDWKNGKWVPYQGRYTSSGRIKFSESAVNIAAGDSQIFDLDGVEIDGGEGFGGRSPFDPAKIDWSADRRTPRNVWLYVNGNPQTLLANNMDKNYVFTNGQTYDIVIPGDGSSSTSTTGQKISIKVNITNKKSTPVTLDGTLQFVLENPDKSGNYHGIVNGQTYTGHSNDTGPLTFSSSKVTLAAGQSQTFTMSKVVIDGDEGLGGRSPLNPQYITWSQDKKAQRNVMLYVNGSDKTVLAENMDPDYVFTEGGTYKIVIPDDGTTPPQDPVDNPSGDDSKISVKFTITNNRTSSVTLDGTLSLYLANPDKSGKYHGTNADGSPYTGRYNSTGKLTFSSSKVTLAAGKSQTFELKNVVITGNEGLGGRSPLDPSVMTSWTGRTQRNVLLYVNNSDGTVLANNMDKNIVFSDGGTYEIVIPNTGSSSSQTPVEDNPNTNPNPSTTGAKIKMNVRIVNNQSTALTLDGDLQFVLANPDKSGNYHGTNADGSPYKGNYNRTGRLKFSSSSVTIPAGQSKTFAMNNLEIDGGEGLGGRSPLEPSKINWTVDVRAPRNVMLYVNNNSSAVLANNMDPNIVFSEGGTYDIVIPNTGSSSGSGSGSGSTTTSGAKIKMNVRIVNNRSTALTLDGDLQFVLANPDKSGNYHGTNADGSPYKGNYNRTGRLKFSSSSVTIPAGQSKTFAMNNLEIDGGEGLGGRSPLEPSKINWTVDVRAPRNVMLYVNNNSSAVLANNMDPNIVFSEGGTYDIVIPNTGSSSGSGSGSGSSTTPTTASGAKIKMNVRIVNNRSTALTLDGDLQFCLANPDKAGNYHGIVNGKPYTGTYNRTGRLRFSSSSVTIPAGQSKTFAMNNLEIDGGEGLGGRSPLEPSKITWTIDTRAPRNVMLYVNNNSSAVLANNMDPNIVFSEGGTYDIVIPNSGSSSSSSTTPTNVTGGTGPIISINLTIKNARSSAVTLDGDLQFCLANPDKAGKYHGKNDNGTPYTGSYNRTGRLKFSTAKVTIPAGGSKTFTMSRVVIDGNEGLGGRSPLHPSKITWTIEKRAPRNVMLYVNNNSSAILADNMDPNIVFAEGGTYTVTLR